MLPENSVVISNGHWMHLFDIESLLYVDFAQGIHGANPVSEYSPGPHLSSNNTKKKTIHMRLVSCLLRSAMLNYYDITFTIFQYDWKLNFIIITIYII